MTRTCVTKVLRRRKLNKNIQTHSIKCYTYKPSRHILRPRNIDFNESEHSQCSHDTCGTSSYSKLNRGPMNDSLKTWSTSLNLLSFTQGKCLAYMLSTQFCIFIRSINVYLHDENIQTMQMAVSVQTKTVATQKQKNSTTRRLDGQTRFVFRKCFQRRYKE